VRRGRPSDVEALLHVHLAAFPDPRPVDVRRRLFLHNRLGGIEHLRVAEQAGAVVGHAFGFPIGAWFGGKLASGHAIASVGVAVDARGRGVATALVEAIHEDARREGGVFTLLYPFRQRFYGRLGYAATASYRVFALSPEAIPREWEQAPGALRRADGRDRREMERVYREAARLGTGFVERTTSMWERDLVEERCEWLVVERNGRLVGYVAFRLGQSEPHAYVRASVNELVATDTAARQSLFGGLRALSGQVREVTVALAADDPLDWAWVDADRDRPGTAEIEHALGVIATGPMLRLPDARAALLARGYASDGSVELSVDGEPPFLLQVKDGTAGISNDLGGDHARVHLTRAALASVAFGGMPLEHALGMGWARTLTPSTDQAALLLRVPPFFSLDAF
jgi:predicted acetyltransferase